MSLIVMCALRQPSQVSSWVSMEKNECGLGELGLNAVVHGLEGHTPFRMQQGAMACL